jgi:acyl carrier protein
MSNDIRDRVKQIVLTHLNVDSSKITDDAKFADDLKADSLDFVELIMALEEEFNLEIPDDEAENIQTFGEAVAYIEAHGKSS